MQTIVTIEDNNAIREAVTAYLRLEDYKVAEFDSCSGVVDFIESNDADLALVDITLPDGDGFQLVKQIRKFSQIPVIFLTSRSTESDRILGFELGGDDYIQKPFSHKELVLRIKAVLKRKDTTAVINGKGGAGRLWKSGEDELMLDTSAHRVRVNNKELNFTTTEWKILTYLISNAHVVLSRDQILNHSLEYNFEGYDRIVDTHIKNIRSKLKPGSWIETVRGYGYSFRGEC